MKRLAILLVVAACSGKAKKDTSGPGSGSGSAIYAKKISVAWGYQASGATTDVFLQTTDEAGNQVSYPLGTYQGSCKTIRPDEAMKAITATACTTGTSGVELDAVVQDEDIVILKGATTGTSPPDPMAREEVTRVKAPGGAKIEAGA